MHPIDEAELREYESRYQALLGFVSPRITSRLRTGLEVDPELVRMQETLRMHAMFPKSFDQKTAQLILFAILLSIPLEAAKIHGWAAYRAGATWEELHDAAGLAYLYRGYPAMNLAGEVWEFIRAQAEKRKAEGL